MLAGFSQDDDIELYEVSLFFFGKPTLPMLMCMHIVLVHYLILCL
jgi:hypothetical protein